MASTNHTAHYGLSQYLADDKPSYLTDYNADMLAIDNAVWAASKKADAAAGSVVPVSSTAQNALTTAQNAKEIAENAQGIAANAQTQANTAIATAGDIPAMAEAFKKAIEAGRTAYLAGLGRVRETAAASSPLTGFLRD